MKRQFKPDCRRVKAGLSGTALALAVSSFLTFQPVQPVQAADEPPASGAADLLPAWTPLLQAEGIMNPACPITGTIKATCAFLP